MTSTIWNETKASVQAELTLGAMLSMVLELEDQAQYELVREIVDRWDDARQDVLRLWLGN